MSLKHKLNRMKNHLNLETNNEVKPIVTSTEVENVEEYPFFEQWHSYGAVPYVFDGQYCWIREVRYPINTQHGHYQFKELKTVVDMWNHSALNHPLSAKGLNNEDLFFFDTETTGLGGGTGITIFLLGYAFFQNDEVVVRQHILPGPGSEIPFYQSFLEQINYETLVTYNGKAFDWPQLKTRHTLIKDHVPKLPEFGHFDLYHASRRLWKQKLEKVKLSAVEEEILGFKRENDIPGYLAPLIYFDYVERKKPDILYGVIKHNELDVLSLITLYIHLSRQIMQVDGYGAESLEIARWMSYLGKNEQAYTTYQTVLKKGTSTEKITAKHAIAFQQKKLKKYEEALHIWKEVSELGEGKQQLEATIECAKLLEHQFKAYEEAIEFVKKAFNYDAGLVAHLLPDFDKRLKRLQKKQQNKFQKHGFQTNKQDETRI